MDQNQVDYAALRFKTAKDLSRVANDVKSGRVTVEPVYVERFGKRILKFRCPPGTRRGGQWTDRLGSDCNLGTGRAGLAKIGRGVSRLGDALNDAADRRAQGGPGLVRYQAGRAAERAGDVVDYLADRRKKRRDKPSKRERSAAVARAQGQAMTDAMLDDAIRSNRELAARADAGLGLDNPKKPLNDPLDDGPDGAGQPLPPPKPLPPPTVPSKPLPPPTGEGVGYPSEMPDLFAPPTVPSETKPLDLTDEQKQNATFDLASRLHEAWRQTRLKPDGTYEPRMKDDGNGGEVDIANTAFADLPEKWQKENLASATHAVNEIVSRPDASDDEIAAAVHEAWLDRNKDWASDELKVPYDELSQDEKDKDLAVVAEARDAIDNARETSTPTVSDPSPTDVGVGYPAEVPDMFAPPQGEPVDMPAPTASGVVPTPETTVLKKPVKKKKPAGPAKAAAASLDDADAKNAKAVGKALPGKQHGTAFKNEKNAKKTAQDVAFDYEQPIFVAKGPDGKFRVVDEERLNALGHDVVAAYDSSGGLIDIPSTEIDSTPDLTEVIEEVKQADLETKIDLIDDLNPPTESPGSLELKKSKTGKFLPDDFSPAHLGYGQITYTGATPEMIAFDAAWEKEADALIDFWEQRVGPINSAAEGLKKIDDYIAQQAIEDSNPGKISVLNAHRNDFVAMLVPHPGQDEANVDQYERINFVGPTRRARIIKDAGLEDYLVGKKKAKAGEVKKIDANAPKPGDGVLQVFPMGSYSDAENAAIALAKDLGQPTFIRQDGETWKVVNEDHLKAVAWKDDEKTWGIAKYVGLEDGFMADTAFYKQYHDDAALQIIPGSNSTGTVMSWLSDEEDNINEAAELRVTKLMDDNFALFHDGDGNLDEKQFKDAFDFASEVYSNTFTEVSQKTQMGTVSQEDLDALKSAGIEKRAYLLASPNFYDSLYQQNQANAVDDPTMPDLDLTPTPEEIKAEKAAKVQAVIDGVLADKSLMEWEKAKMHGGWDADLLMQGHPSFDDEDSLDAYFDAKVMAVESSQPIHDTAIQNYKDSGYITSDQVLIHVVRPLLRKEWLEKEREKAKAELAQKNAGSLQAKHEEMILLSSTDKSNVYFFDEDEDISFVDKNSPTLAEELQKSPHDVVYLDGVWFAKDEMLNTLTSGSAPEDATPAADPFSEMPEINDFNKQAAFEALYGSGLLVNFDVQKIMTVEGGKLGDTISQIASRATKYGPAYQAMLDKIPDNFHQLSPDAQRQAIVDAVSAATGKNVDEERAAIEFARAAIASQFGTADSLDALNQAYLLHQGLVAGTKKANILAADHDAIIAEQTERLKAALEAMDGIGDMSEPVKLAYKHQVNDATALIVAAQIAKFVKTKESPGVTVEQLSAVGKDLAHATSLLDPKIKVQVEKAIYNGVSVEKGEAGFLAAKDMIKPASAYDSTLLGSVSGDGKAIAYHIPVGHKGLWSDMDAASHLQSGGNLSDVPDAFVESAINATTGPGKRFTKVPHSSGYNESWTVVDTLTNQRYVIKKAHRNHMEHIQEAAAAVLAQRIGHSMQGIRMGSDAYEDATLPAEQKKIEGVKAGLQRAIIVDTAHNFFGGQVFDEAGNPTQNADGYIVWGSPANVPSNAVYDGESLARLMVLDRSGMYIDRTNANMIAVSGPDGKVRLHPIDHGNAFREFDPSKTSGLSEMQIGFTMKPKSDNKDLFALVKQLPPEERERWAAALVDGVDRFQKTNWDAEFTAIGERLNLTQAERDRLKAHAAFLEKRKSSLEWEQMMANAIGGVGYDQEEVYDFIAGGHQVKAFKLPPDAKTVTNSVDKVEELKPKNSGFSMFYDGGDIKNFHVIGTNVTVKNMMNANGTPYEGEATQLTFQLSQDAIDSIGDPASAGFTEMAKFIPIPRTNTNGSAAWDFNDLMNPANLPDPKRNINGHGNTTWSKVMPDGSIVMFTKSNIPKDGIHGMVRIIMPGKPSDNMTNDEAVKMAMTAAGVKSHSMPAAKEVHELGIRQLGLKLLGGTSKQWSTDKILEELAKRGYSADDIELGTDISGSPIIRLSQSATDKIMQDSKLGGVSHYLGHNANNDAEVVQRIISVFSAGMMASTNRRFMHAIPVAGMSSASDVKKGSSDQLFFHPVPAGYTSTVLGSDDLSVGKWNWVGAGQDFWRRIDMYLSIGDTYGDTDDYAQAAMQGPVSGGWEVMLNSAQKISTGITVVSPSTYTQIIDELHNRGVYEVDGIPIEKLIATPANVKAKGKALIQILKTKGLAW